MRPLALAFLALLLAGSASAQEAPPKSPEWSERLEFGPLVLEVRASRTAHLFHVVDQLSNWSEFCHSQYRKAMGLDAEDEKALERHKAIRLKKGWGGGLEQAFYTHLPLDEALAAGVKAGHLAEGQAAIEKEVFLRFEKRVDALFAAQSADLRRSLASLDRDTVTRMAKSLARLCRLDSLTVPFFPMASPTKGMGGGGFNGGRMVVEIGPDSDAAPTLVHELVHAFLEPRKDLLAKCAAATEGLDEMTLNEGIAYAVMPGIFSAGKEDRLAAKVDAYRRAGRGLGENYPRFHMFGLELRPAVQEALGSADLDRLLKRAGSAWRTLVKEEPARARATPRDPRVYIAGPGWRAGTDRVKVERPGIVVPSFRHREDYYRQFLGDLRPGDLFVATFAGDSEDRVVPEGWEDLLAAPLADVWTAVKAGKTLEKSANARGIRVVLLAAPTKEALDRLIRETKSLAE